MSTRRSLAYAAGGLGAAARRQPWRPGWWSSDEWSAPAARARPRPTGSARCTPTPVEVTCDDGVVLHAEVDEVAPYAESASAGAATKLTLVFVHGYALNLDCWHFQREAFRGKHRMAFYDQRSHGRSERSDREHATIDQLGDDLAG